MLLALSAVVGGLTHAQTGQTLATVIDFVFVSLILATIQTYSRAIAVRRLEIARECHKKHVYEQVIAVLQPYLGRRSRFDPTGEAHWLLGHAAKKLGEDELVAYCKVFLTRFRKGEWSKKASKL